MEQAAPAVLVEGALGKIRQYYLFPEHLDRIEEEIRRRLAAGEYDGLAGR